MWTLITISTIDNIKAGMLVAKNNPNETELEPIYTVLSVREPEMDEIRLEIKTATGNRQERSTSKTQLITETWHFDLKI